MQTSGKKVVAKGEFIGKYVMGVKNRKKTIIELTRETQK